MTVANTSTAWNWHWRWPIRTGSRGVAPTASKSGGEAGTTPALGAILNGIVDALKDLGVKDVEMPATPLRVWQAIQDAAKNP